MSTGETASEQSPQKVSSTILLKLALSCIRNSIFKPAGCQSRCAASTRQWVWGPAWMKGCRLQPWACTRHPGCGARPPPARTCLCRVARGCVNVWYTHVLPKQRARPSASCPGLRGQTAAGQTDRNSQRCRRMQERRGGGGRQVERTLWEKKRRRKEPVNEGWGWWQND